MKYKIGYEIEGVINTDIVDFDIGEYHQGKKVSNFFKIEKDGSILKSYTFLNEKPAEFVSEIVTSKKFFLASLEDFKKLLKGNIFELEKVIYFNTSTGTHFHFSVKNFHFYDRIPVEIFFQTRKYFFSKLRNAKIREDLKNRIKKNYFRFYSKRVTRKNFLVINRYKEWNFYSEREGKGLEWRSFNLNDVRTWDEFFTLMKIAFETLMFLKNKIKKWCIRKEYIFREYENFDFEIKEEVIREENINIEKEIYEEIICAI